MNKSLVVAKINFRNIKLAYIITAITMGVLLAQDIVFILLDYFDVFRNPEGNMTVSFGNYLFLALILGAILIPARNFRKMMNLGGKRTDFFRGCAVNYVIIAALISFACIIFYYTYDRFVVSVFYRGGTLDVLFWFGWLENGVIIAFFRQFAFLLLLAVFVHTLTAAQDKWYGWLADVVIVAIISTFTSISALRPALIWFFNLIIFHQNTFLQIAACLALSAAVYSLNRFMFARKAI
ncbi:MAG: hypothetical protein LBD23_20270 [Oscillospiraceae bacterium]|jgi:hypothetical protein|nr:hypothetical protein [Oscillospiraceae bacterium]